MSDKEEARSVFRVKLTDNEILLSATSPEGWSITFDKEPTKVIYIELQNDAAIHITTADPEERP